MQHTNFIQRYESCFGKASALTLKLAGLQDPEVVGCGALLRSACGKEWLDFGSFGIHLLGHCHPQIVQVAREQISRLGLSSKILGNQVATECGAKILSSLPSSMDRIIFANSGAEAIEIALKMSLLRQRGNRFVALKGAYHGKTLGALSVSDIAKPTEMGMCHRVDFVHRNATTELRQLLATGDVAAVLMEPVQGEGGIRAVSDSFLLEALALCDENDSVLICDEIQCGLGRCGRLWKSVDAGCVPDVLAIGKTLGGGIAPISAVVYQSRKFSYRASDPLVHASSFAGGALACSIATKVVEIVSDDSFLSNVRQLGAWCRHRLQNELADLPYVSNIRGEGLMLGIELETPRHAGEAVLNAAKRGVLISFCLTNPRVLRIYPPAVTGEEELQRGMNAIVESIRELC